MSAEESELSGTANHEKEGQRQLVANKTVAPTTNVNSHVCHNIFPHCLTIPGDLFQKEKGGGGDHCNNEEAVSSKFISSKLKDLEPVPKIIFLCNKN